MNRGNIYIKLRSDMNVDYFIFCNVRSSVKTENVGK